METEVQEVEIKKENYEKFIQLATHMGSVSDDVFTFNLEALARMVDIAYCEGQIKELTSDEAYAENIAKITKLEALQQIIENAMPEGFIEMEY